MQNFPVEIEIHQLTHKHKEKFDNTKSLIRSHKSKKDRQYNGQKGETIQRPKRRDNTTTKKERQYNGQKGETIQWPKRIDNTTCCVCL